MRKEEIWVLLTGVIETGGMEQKNLKEASIRAIVTKLKLGVKFCAQNSKSKSFNFYQYEFETFAVLRV